MGGGGVIALDAVWYEKKIKNIPSDFFFYKAFTRALFIYIYIYLYLYYLVSLFVTREP